jgi:hypothetical protein
MTGRRAAVRIDVRGVVAIRAGSSVGEASAGGGPVQGGRILIRGEAASEVQHCTRSPAPSSDLREQIAIHRNPAATGRYRLDMTYECSIMSECRQYVFADWNCSKESAMKITFACEHCGHQFAVDESLAGQHGRCKSCGREMDVPAPEFRLEPLAEDASDRPEVERPSAPPRQSSSPGRARKEGVKLAPVEKPSRRPSSSEDDPDDGKPYQLDKDFEPPQSAVPSSADPILMEARAGWRHTVRVITGKLSKFEDAIYLILMVFWLIGAVAFLFELKPLAWTMLGLLVICSFLLLLLDGFEVFIKPFQEGLRHGLAFVLIPPYAIYYVATRWKQMKRPFKKAIGAFGPLIVLLLLVVFSRPIRDWFLHAPPKKSEGETPSISSGVIPSPVRSARTGGELQVG